MGSRVGAGNRSPAIGREQTALTARAATTSV